MYRISAVPLHLLAYFAVRLFVFDLLLVLFFFLKRPT